MRSRSVRALVVCAALFAALTVSPRADTTAQPLTFFENWNDVTRISAANNWNGVHGIIGYRGDGMVSSTGVNPQGVIADGSGTPVNVMANQTNPNTNTTGGIAEFEIADPVVALQGSGTARAPHVVMTLTTVGQSSIHVSYNLRDVDNSTDNAISPVALQYRVGTSGSYTNVPGAFVADASVQAPATLVTPVSVDLPAAVANQPVVQLRIITTDAAGSDEWIGIDDIRVTGTTIAGDTAPAITATSPTNLAANVAVDSPISITFSEPVAAGSGAFALQCGGTAQAFETSASPSDTFVLTPLPRLPFARNCTVTVLRRRSRTST